MGEHEMNFASLKALSDNPWFKLGGRVCMWASPFLFATAGWLLNDLRTNTIDQIEAVKTSVSSVVSTQTSRAADNERFQTEMLKFQAASLAADERQGQTLVSVQTDIGIVKGILQAQERRELAVGFKLP